MDAQERAAEIFGRPRAEVKVPNATPTMLNGTATSDSADGSVSVQMPGEMVTADGTDSVTMPTVPVVKAGDDLIISNIDGTPVVTGVVGGGDRQQTDIGKGVTALDQLKVPQYTLALNVSSIERYPDGSFYPTSLIASAYVRVSGDYSAYSAGEIKLYTSADGSNWTLRRYVFGQSITYTCASLPISTGDRYVKATLTDANGTVQVTETLAVVDVTGNYIVQDQTGLYLTQTQNDKYTGANLRLASDTVTLRSGQVEYTSIGPNGVRVGPTTMGNIRLDASTTDPTIGLYAGSTQLAMFSSDELDLGMNSASSIIKLCGETSQIQGKDYTNGYVSGNVFDAGIMQSSQSVADVICSHDSSETEGTWRSACRCVGYMGGTPAAASSGSRINSQTEMAASLLTQRAPGAAGETQCYVKASINTLGERHIDGEADIVSGMSTCETATGSAATLALSAGTVTQITLDTVVASVGSGFAFASGGIRCKYAGKVAVSGAAYVMSGPTGAAGCYLYIGSSEVAESVSPCNANVYGYSVSVAPKIISVNAGDVIYLKARSIGVAGTAYPNNNGTYLTVEYKYATGMSY